MKRYTVTVHWHGMKWHLDGLAHHSAELIAGLIRYFGPGCFVTCRVKS